MRTNDFYLVAAAASMMMFAACTHDDGTLSTASPASNEIVITTRSSDIGFTRAESDIQSTQFLNGEHIDIFLRDASGVADSTTYGNPYNYQTNGSGGGILTRDGSTVVKVYWPKLMHPLYIYGIYPQGAVGWSKRKTSCADADYKSGNKAYDKDFRYYFIVAADQTSEANYKASDLMTGLPSRYDEESGHTGAYTAPFRLTQKENPHTIPLTFTHRLTKIIVNITKTSETADISMDDIKYSGEGDNVFARVTLLNTKRKTWFQLYGASSADVVAATRVDVGDEGVDAQPTPTTVIVGQGATALSNNASSVTLSAIVPPQTIISGSEFIQVELIDNRNNPSGPDNVTNTFKYKLDSDLTLQASKVHTYNIRINKPNITVTTSITNWDAVDAVNPVGVLQ